MSPEAWTAINSIAVLALAILAFYERQHNRVTARSVEEVKEAVNGPLSLALKSNAKLSRRISDLTGNDVDLAVAAKAAAVEENRVEGKSAAKES